jgi:L-2-hydroxyglutarate oxidase LhgO
MKKYDCVIIGAGFFGSVIALLVSEYFNNVLLIESENDIMTKASFANQARVHMGYHYPRSLLTAYRSSINFYRFIDEFKSAIKTNFENYYGIAKIGSKINSRQFCEIYKKINAPIEIASNDVKKLFNLELIEEVFKVEEAVFDADILRQLILEKFTKTNCKISLNSKVNSVEKYQNNLIKIVINDQDPVLSKLVFNCGYSGLNSILKQSNLELLNLKHEISEISLIDLPKEIKDIGITIMDGPYFSILPFPVKNLNSLSHVRYTPHLYWIDKEKYFDGYEFIKLQKLKSKFRYMIKDAQRFMPILRDAKYVDSIYEIKTTQVKNEIDDARPILYSQDTNLENFINVMGAKIDNIYDIIAIIKQLNFKHFI